MKETLYFDLVGGISGDMTVAALLELGLGFNELKLDLKRIRLGGYSLEKRYLKRGHVRAAKFDVVVKKEKNFSYQQIVRLIKESTLSGNIKTNILKVYEALAGAEVKVHGHRDKNIKFRQLGEIDSIVDIAAACICLDRLAPDEILYSLIPVNKTIAPATHELFTGKRIYFTDQIYENVTPTGMAILSALGRQSDPFLKSVFLQVRCGYGAGSFDSVAGGNVLRVMQLKGLSSGFESDEVQVIEANIDDMNPQFFEYLFERLFEAGALDVFVSSVYMKKSRPGFLLTALSKVQNLAKIADIILRESTSLGVRFSSVGRLKLIRGIKSIDLRGRKVRIKLAQSPGGDFRTLPEYEDCKILAQKTKIPISEIYDEVKKKAGLTWRSRV